MTSPAVPLPRAFYDRPVLDVARDLLGALVHADAPAGRVTVRLSEVEAYLGSEDPASHAYRGPTRRNATMFGPPGHLYVYFTYGMHWCANLVCGPPATPRGVLLRAGEVVAGVDLAASRRLACRQARDLARGPARLAAALGLDGGDDGADVTGGGRVTVAAGCAAPDAMVQAGPRVGVSAGAVHPYRFSLLGEPTVSAYRPAAPRHRRPAGSTS